MAYSSTAYVSAGMTSLCCFTKSSSSIAAPDTSVGPLLSPSAEPPGTDCEVACLWIAFCCCPGYSFGDWLFWPPWRSKRGFSRMSGVGRVRMRKSRLSSLFSSMLSSSCSSSIQSPSWIWIRTCSWNLTSFEKIEKAVCPWKELNRV